MSEIRKGFQRRPDQLNQVAKPEDPYWTGRISSPQGLQDFLRATFFDRMHPTNVVQLTSEKGLHDDYFEYFSRVARMAADFGYTNLVGQSFFAKKHRPDMSFCHPRQLLRLEWYLAGITYPMVAARQHYLAAHPNLTPEQIALIQEYWVAPKDGELAVSESSFDRYLNGEEIFGENRSRFNLPVNREPDLEFYRLATTIGYDDEQLNLRGRDGLSAVRSKFDILYRLHPGIDIEAAFSRSRIGMA